MNNKNNKNLIIAIVLIGVLISASLLFVGYRIGQSPASIDETELEQKIEEGIERFVKKQIEDRQKKKSGILPLDEKSLQKFRKVAPDRDHIRGDPKARISLIEYSDFECPFCKSFHPTAQQIVKKYNGKVNWVYRHFPLGFHNPGAQKEAEASECAAELGGNEAFWRYTDLIYQRTKSNGKGFPVDKLVPLAKETGLDEKKFSTCLDSGKKEARVQEDYQDGVAIGVTGTPGNILFDNQTGKALLMPGAQPVEKFSKVIEDWLKEQ